MLVSYCQGAINETHTWAIKTDANPSRVVWNIRNKFGPLPAAWAPVAEVHGPTGEANAQLIAVAPEMLNALIKISKFKRDLGGGKMGPTEAAEIAQAAISKVTP